MRRAMIERRSMSAIEQEDTLKTVLLVEDSPGEVRLMMEAFHEDNKSVLFRVVGDGVAAMAFLRREGKFATAPRPDLILLDLNLPIMSGREVLAQIKADDGLKSIPTIVLTTSDAPEDIAYCYQHQANSYLCKPMGFELFDKLIKSINDCWLANSMSPERGASNANVQSSRG